jgi:HPt (histidine-containing phosphotransfer) domain-containing protein
MDGYLTKPVTVARLREVLVAWLPVCAAAEPVPTLPLQQDEALDRSVLEAWFGEDRLAMADLLDRFVETAKAAAPALREAVSQADWARLRNEAHRLKGVARAVGANPLAEVADVLERASAENQAAQGLRALAAVLPAALEAVRDVITSYRHGH